MRGPYVIMDSKSQIVGFGYDLWNTNEEAIKNLSEKYETIKKVLDESYNTKKTYQTIRINNYGPYRTK